MSTNARESTKHLTTASAVANTAAAPLITPKAVIRNGTQGELFIKIGTVGSMTDLRVRLYVSDRESPAAFTAGGNADWAPLPVASFASGAATMDVYEAQFAKATWFPTDGKMVVIPFRATGVWLVAELYDGAGNGASSLVTTRVYLREEG